MRGFIRPQTVIAIGAGAIFFIGGILLFVYTNEPVEVALEDTNFVPVEVVDNPFEEPNPLPETKITEEPQAPEEEPVQEKQEQQTSIEEPLPVTPEEPKEQPTAQVFVPENLEAADKELQEALVNILCLADAGSPVGSISGSGVIIDPSGTILTNAHIAQYLLLKDYPTENSIECTIRTGSPATPAYIADLAYISPQWIYENADELTKDNPTGTGKDDFALLTITGPAPFQKLPESFPFIPLSFNEASVGESVISAGYPASFLEPEAIQRNLVQIRAAGTIQDIYTFNKTTVDVLSLGGVPLAQQGASGGAVVDGTGTLRGIVVTSSLETNTQERDLRAISTGHIARSFMEQHSVPFIDYALGDITSEYEEFNKNVAPTLTDLLIAILER
ncbi:MAG: serine protease [Patescibacteria group bacterium UBA2103]